MTFTRTWNEASPADSNPAREGAQEIRQLKQDVHERFALEHMYGTATADPFGMHKWAAKSVATSPYTVTTLDNILLVDCSSGSITLNLPAVASVGGKPYTIIKTDTSLNSVIIDGSGVETVGGRPTLEIKIPRMGIKIFADTLVEAGWKVQGLDWKLEMLDHGTQAADYTIDLSLAHVHLVAFSAIRTLTISASLFCDRGIVIVKNNNYTITLSGIQNNSPTLTKTANTQDFLMLVKSFGMISCIGFVNNFSTS